MHRWRVRGHRPACRLMLESPRLEVIRMSKESLDRMVILAAGAVSGGVATTPEEAAEFAATCYEKVREADKKRIGNAKAARVG